MMQLIYASHLDECGAPKIYCNFNYACIENYLSGNPDFMENLFAYEIRFYVTLNVLYCIAEIFAVYILELKFMIIV